MNLLRGIFELGVGRAIGLGRMGGTPRDFLNSLYVLMAVPVLTALVLAAHRGLGNALAVLMVLVCALLAPPVIAHFFARAWGREALWLRFAVAFNWSRFAVVSVFAIMLAVTAILIAAGVPGEAAAELMIVAVSVYSLWLEWFISRQALRVSAGRAILLVLGMNLGTFALLSVPGVLIRAMVGGGLAG